MSHTPCACYVEDNGDQNEPAIVSCPLHAQAGAMRDTLRTLVGYHDSHFGCQRRADTREACWCQGARAILRVVG